METQAVEVSLSRLYHRDLAGGKAVLINNSDLIFFQILQIAVSSELTSSLIAKKALKITKERNEGVEDELLSSNAWSSTGLGRLSGARDGIPAPSHLPSLEGHSSLPFAKCWTNSKIFTSLVDLVISLGEDGLCPELN